VTAAPHHHRVVLVRHGQTEWSRSGRHTGDTDIPLTEEGRVQARAVTPRLQGHTFAQVLSSPLQRARDTCSLSGFGDQAVIDEDLREWNYGDYEGITTASIRETRPDWLLWRDGCPGGDSPESISLRADRVVARLRAAGGHCLVYSHGHFLRVLAARWVNLPVSAGSVLRLDTATVSSLSWEREVPVIRRWNDDRHLDPTGL
jgi:probable phosphoglycerate mutase